MADPIHAELIRQAAEAARAGDRDTARQKLETVLQEDDENVTAWLLLARITTNNDERRMALTTVLQLDPKNERAKQMMERLKEETSRESDEIIPGVSRRAFRLVLLVSVGVLLVFVLIFYTLSSGESAREANERNTATAVVLAITREFVNVLTAEGQNTQVALQISETAAALISPTPSITPTSNRPTLPPSFTPEPTFANEVPTALPALQNVPGRIIGWSGRDLQNVDALPITIYTLGGVADGVPFSEDIDPGADVDANSSGQRLIYTQRQRNQTDLRVTMVDANGIAVNSLLDQASSPGGYLEAKMPRFSADGSRVVYIGESLNTGSDSIFILNLNAGVADTSSVIQLTNDTADYSYPSFSPDGTRVVAVRNDGEGGIDLVMIEVNTRAPTYLTTDQDAVRETTPRWAPNGSLVAYAAAPAEDRNNNDIYLISPANPNSGTAIVTSPGDDRFPVFSPDGRFIAFSSNRGRSYDIFIQNLASQELFQLTDNDIEDYPGVWLAG
ncbi:MAG: hypothetical protein OHK0046_09460 [Anaerolineae bacterium]